MILTIFVRRADGTAMREEPLVIIDEQPSPDELAAIHARSARYERNMTWFQAHLDEIRARHLGKCLCIAGEELFVADTPQEAIALARAAHPADDGRITQYLSPVKGPRIYANQRSMAPMQ